MGHAISPNTVRKLLIGLGFSRQSNRKADEGSRHPDRDAQFEHINGEVNAAQAAGQPVIFVDMKKKELIGNFKNGGTDYRPKGDPRRVKVHDFEDKSLGRVPPKGFTTWPLTRAGSASGFPPTRQNSRWPPSARGSSAWGAGAIPRRAN